MVRSAAVAAGYVTEELAAASEAFFSVENGINEYRTGDIGIIDEEGVGLDSLAPVQFLTAIRQEFNAQIPVVVWSRVDQLTQNECAGLVLSASR